MAHPARPAPTTPAHSADDTTAGRPGGFRCRQAGPGRHLWQTPHGDCYLNDHTGTHRLRADHAAAILTAPAGVDAYPDDRTLVYVSGSG